LLYSKTINQLPASVDYPGEYGLLFEKAVSAWWIGKKEESLNIFLELLKQDILDIYRNAIIYNVKRIDPNAAI
jgi:hypothetical protein